MHINVAPIAERKRIALVAQWSLWDVAWLVASLGLIAAAAVVGLS